MDFVDSRFNYDYRKRYFFDLHQKKLEKKIEKTDTKKKKLIRTSLTPNERMIQGLKNELNSYKKMFIEEQNLNLQLRSEIYNLSNENLKYKTQLQNINRIMDNSLSKV